MEEKVVFTVANLARLRLSEEESTVFPKQFANIVSFIESLKEVDTQNVPPFYELIQEESHYRDDTPIGSITNDEALRNAPQAEGGFFVVPRVVG